MRSKEDLLVDKWMEEATEKSNLYYDVYHKLIDDKIFDEYELDFIIGVLENQYNQDLDVELLNAIIREAYPEFKDYKELFGWE